MKRNNKLLYVGVWLFLLILVVGALVNDKASIITKIKRPDYSEKADTYSLMAQVENETFEVNIKVEPMKIEEANLQSCFDEAFEIVCEKLPGENSSLKEVKANLNLVDEVKKYGINVTYHSENTELIKHDGEVRNRNVGKGGESCDITIGLEYEGYYQEYVVTVIVYPPVLSKEEIISEQISEKVLLENEKSGEEYVKLPNEINGKEVTFVEQSDSKIPVVVVALLFLLLFWYYRNFVVKRNLEKAREKEMMLDYGEIVSKLSLLMGAGMSSVTAFTKIATDYKVALNHGKGNSRCAYEEIVATTNRISTGMSEIESFSIFGKACRLHSYIKLSSLLIQNSRKGGDGFTQAIKYEATQGFIERKAMAQRTGEEAGTKLLLPMGMMLCVVLVIIIVPAFMSF